ncbi:MAG: hypothetical protein ACI81W_001330 [Saprospiraceae bacterium]
MQVDILLALFLLLLSLYLEALKILIMKVYHFFIAFLLMNFNSFAQMNEAPAKITWGSELEEPNNSFISKVIPAGDNFYAIRRKTKSGLVTGSKKVYIEKYNSEMKLEKSQDIALKYKNKELDFEDVIILNNNLFLLSSFHNKGKGKNYLFSQMINMRNLSASKNLSKIGEIETRGINREGSFGVHISRDSSKVLIYNDLPYKKGKPERFSLKVFNDSFEELWNRDIILPYDDEHFSVEEYQVDKDGNVYLLGVIYQDPTRTRRQGKPTYQYTILTYTSNGEEVQEYKIDFKDNFITDLTFRVGDDGDLVCSGFYSAVGDYSIKGTYFFRLNPQTNEIYNRNLKDFDFDFLTEFMSDRKKKNAEKAEREGNTKKQVELFSYSLDNLVLRSDGGALLIAEQYYVQSQRDNDYYGSGLYSGYFNPRRGYYNNSVNQVEDHYNYNDIIVVNIKPTGEIEWAARIPKRQETIDDGGYYSSYAMSIVKDRIFFVFNDNIKNFQEKKRPEKVYNFNGSNSIIALAEVTRDGAVNTYPLFSNREAGTLTLPKICKQSGKNKMTIYGERGRRYRFANIEFTN